MLAVACQRLAVNEFTRFFQASCEVAHELHVRVNLLRREVPGARRRCHEEVAHQLDLVTESDVEQVSRACFVARHEDNLDARVGSRGETPDPWT